MSGDVKAKVPVIRFAGFNSDWVKDYLGNRVKFFSGLTYSPSDVIKESGTLVLRSSNIQGGEIVGIDNVYVKPEVVNCKNVEVGDIVVVVRNGSRNLIGKHAMVKKEMENTVIGAFMTGISSQTPEFINALLNTTQFNFEVEKNLGATINQITTGSFRNMNFHFINGSEAEKIGDFFKHFDGHLNYHQTQLDKLSNLKQAMLQKMFPQGDAVVPEIRFQGFAGEWKKHQLSNIGDIIGGGTPSTGVAKYWNGNIDWYSPTEIGSKVYADGSVKKITKEGLEKSSAKILPANRTILFTSRAGIGDTAILRHEGCTNQGFQSLVLNDGIDPYFIYSMAYLIKNYALKYASGSTFLEISSKQLGKMSLLLPNEEEQQKIGNYFRKLDELIALHQTQLEKLKQIKLGCLGRMFV